MERVELITLHCGHDLTRSKRKKTASKVNKSSIHDQIKANDTGCNCKVMTNFKDEKITVQNKTLQNILKSDENDAM